MDPPSTRAVCAAAALATVELLDHPNSAPGGEWHDAVAAWNGARIRKIVRRGRASAWNRVQEIPGLTVSRDGAEVRAFVPGPTDQVPAPVAKLQVQSSDLDEITRTSERPTESGLIIAVTPQVEMSWGKQAAQCAHAAHRAWMAADDDVLGRWVDGGRPITVVHPVPGLWDELREEAAVAIRDGGFTEIPAGTNTTIALWF